MLQKLRCSCHPGQPAGIQAGFQVQGEAAQEGSGEAGGGSSDASEQLEMARDLSEAQALQEAQQAPATTCRHTGFKQGGVTKEPFSMF